MSNRVRMRPPPRHTPPLLAATVLDDALLAARIAGRPLRLRESAPAAVLERFDPDQPRDDHGRWTDMHPGTPGEIQAFKARFGKAIPPAWTDVQIADDLDSASLLVTGRDAKGRRQAIYSAEHTRGQAAKKFARIRELDKHLDKLDHAVQRDAGSDDNAAALLLIRRLGMRPGSTRDTRSSKKAYGATTLLAKHATVDGDTARFAFTGKKGVDIRLSTGDPDVVAAVRTRLESRSGDEPLFDTDVAKVRDYMHSTGVPAGFLLKDLRTVLANTVALREIRDRDGEPSSKAEFQRWRRQVATTVSKALGNTPTMALQSYINPTVFGAWAKDPAWAEAARAAAAVGRAEEKKLLAAWFATVSFDEPETGVPDVVPDPDDPDDDGRAELAESLREELVHMPVGLAEASVSDKPWSDFTQADYTPQQWRRACLVDRGEGDEDSKQRYALPVKEPTGTLNRNGVHAAAGGHGIGAVKGISDEQRHAVAKKLVSLYHNQLDEEPPESLLSLAGMSEAATPGPVTLTEATGPGAMRSTGSRRYRARLIEGDRWGASGYYSRAVLERDGHIFSGRLMYLDHPTPTEEAERPERSVRDLAAKIVSTPRYEGDGLYADIEVFAHAAPIVEALADSIGLSIRAAGTAEYGEAAGREGMIITGLSEGYSVDFVTQAGAGGRLVALLESARGGAVLREARTIGAWLESRLHLALTQLADDMYGDGRLTRDERIALSSAIGEGLKAYTSRIEAAAPGLFERDLYDEPAAQTPAEMREATTEDVRRTLEHLLRQRYGGNDRYLYVYDYDAARGLVWYEVCERDGESVCWQQGYTRDDGELSLSADRVRAERRTIYVPVDPDERGSVYESAAATPVNVTDGAVPAAPTNPSEEEPVMSGTQTGASPGNTAGTAQVAESAISAEARAQIAESKLAEAQAQITALQAEKTSLVVERDTARGEVRRLRATEAARGACEKVLRESDLPAPTRQRITESVSANVPVSEAGEVDTAALTAAITAQVEAERAYIASIREAAGEGTPTGLGASSTPADLSGFKDDLAARMRRLGLSEAAAKSAAGR